LSVAFHYFRFSCLGKSFDFGMAVYVFCFPVSLLPLSLGCQNFRARHSCKNRSPTTTLDTALMDYQYLFLMSVLMSCFLTFLCTRTVQVLKRARTRQAASDRYVPRNQRDSYASVHDDTARVTTRSDPRGQKIREPIRSCSRSTAPDGERRRFQLIQGLSISNQNLATRTV
jgi:hypothetical protein